MTNNNNIHSPTYVVLLYYIMKNYDVHAAFMALAEHDRLRALALQLHRLTFEATAQVESCF